MAATTFTQEFQTAVAPEKMFRTLIIDAPNTIPKAIPQVVKSIEREAGSIRRITYTHGSPLKLKIDALDTQNLTCKYTLIDGEMLGDKCESISYELKFERSCNGGSDIKVKGEYRTKGGCDCSTDVNAEKEKITGMFKAAEGYILANPAICA